LTAIHDQAFIWQSKRINVQVSLGISSTDELTHTENENDLLCRANDRCFRAKRSENILYSIAI
jgi:GGDEF domain-containing protein